MADLDRFTLSSERRSAYVMRILIEKVNILNFCFGILWEFRDGLSFFILFCLPEMKCFIDLVLLSVAVMYLHILFPFHS